MALAPGTILNNRYRIVSTLGQGGMGAVYQAFDENLGINVAVKENLFLTEEYARQFQREANILATVHHPNLPRVGDYFAVPNQGQYLIMDFIDGEDLRQRIERLGIIPEKEVIVIGAAMCEALTYLHNRRPPIIHRDIKPGNIKITPEGHAQLVDFGLAKVMVGGEQTTTGARAMTPGYSPPEQYGTAPTDARTDIYSLGATLYAALSGIIPEDGLARATGKAELTPIREIIPKVSRKLAAALETALDVDPDRRYQTAEDFKNSLLDAGNIEHAPDWRTQIVPPPPTPVTAAAVNGEKGSLDGLVSPSYDPFVQRRSSRPKSRRQKRSPLLPAAMVLAAALAIYFLAEPISGVSLRSMIFHDSPTAPATQSMQATMTEEPGEPTDLQPSASIATEAVLDTAVPQIAPPEKSTSTPTITPTPFGGGAGQIAFSSNRTGIMQVWLMNVDGSQQHPLTNMPDGACEPTWSPDGQKIALISPCLARRDTYEGSKIFILDLAANSEPYPLPVPPSPAADYDPAWSPDGAHIAFTSTRSGNADIYVFNIFDNTFRQLTSTHTTDKHPAWSPTGTQLAFVRDNPSSQIWIMSDTGQFQTRFTISGEMNDLWPVWAPDGAFILYSQMSGGNVPWLESLRYDQRNTANSIRVPVKGQPDVGPVVQPSISPDGAWIVFESWPDGTNHDIYLMTINGANRLQLTTDKDFDFGPAWRPVPQTSTP